MSGESRSGEGNTDLSLLRAVAAAPATVPPRALEGTRVGRYLVEEKIGQGGMGVVYRAKDEKLGRLVALKLLPAALAHDEERKKRFLREARAAAALSHPNVAAIYEVDEHDGAPFIAMELVDGEPLSTLVQRRPATAEVRRLALDVARGLAKAHASGIVHRDLKPANVRVTKDGTAKLLDFGLARLLLPDAQAPLTLTAEGTIVGTPAYMAPEQVEGKATDAASDVFSFGVLLCELLTGAVPWRATSSSAMVAAVLRDDAAPALVRPDLDASLVAVALRCLEKEPARRYQNGGELVAALEAGAHATPKQTRPAFWQRRPRTALALSFLLGAFFAAVECGEDGEDGDEGGAPLMTIDIGSAPGWALRSQQRLTDAAGVEAEATISPDGKQIVYVAPGDGFTDLFAVRAGGARAINLTHSDEEEHSPAFSADGEQIAFVAGVEPTFAVYVMGATGESRRKIVDDGFHPSWTPDGKQLVYSTANWTEPNARPSVGEVWTVDVASGARTKLVDKDAAQPSVSPDGASVAFWRNENGQRDVLVAPRAGGAPIALTHDVPLDFNPAWAPDGKSVFFLSNRGGERNLWVVPFDARRKGPAPSPSLVVGGPSRLTSVSVAKTGRAVATASARLRTVVRLPLNAAGARVGEPAVVFSSSRELVAHSASAEAKLLAIHLFEPVEDLLLVSWDGTAPRQITNDPDKQRSPVLSRNGERVLFYGNAGGRWRAWTVRADGSDVRPIDPPAGVSELIEPIWSPDERRIVATSIEEGLTVLFDLNADGLVAASRVLSRSEGAAPHLRPLDWSRDGSSILGVTVVDGEMVGIGLFDLASGEHTTIPLRGMASKISPPHFTPDGKHALYARVPGDVVVRDLEKGTERIVHQAPRGVTVENVAVSADGTAWITTEQLQSDLWLFDLTPPETPDVDE